MTNRGSAIPFLVGQRWSSDTESELGLGLVRTVDARQLIVMFPAAGETRCYSTDAPPLHRVHFEAGDTILDREGNSLCIVRVEEDADGLLVYHGEAGEQMRETELADNQHRDQPLDRLWGGQLSRPEEFDLRKDVADWFHTLQAHPACGFIGGKVRLIPHQFYIANEVARRASPRVLLCDEVGLGKTIEALLILHRMWVSGAAERVLILVPDALVNQWFVELYRRFNLRARIVDAEHVDEHLDDSNVFDHDSLVLCGIDWLAQQPAVAQAAAAAEWDLMIVDEAHHLHWTRDEVGPKYRLVEALCEHVPGVLLLTATPEQLGRESHFARLRLLDPHRYHDLDTFMTESHSYRETAERAMALDEAGEQDALVELLDRHGPGRVVFRNTRAAIKGFPGRKAHLVTLKDETQAREKWLAEFLTKHPGRKVVLICVTQKDAVRINERMKRLVSVPTAVFHEGLTLIQRDRSAAWFSELDGARLLVSSEIGGEGRNFQCAHDLVLYDLPLNPEVIEQRIGRLDRIGQTETVQVWVPFVKDSPESYVATWFHKGLNAFEHFLAGGNETYAPLMAQFSDAQSGVRSFTDFIKESVRHRDQVAEALEAGRDRLMELHSFRPEPAAALLASVSALDTDRDYEAYVLKLFEALGVYAEETADRCYLIKTHDLVSDTIQGLSDERQHVTFDREIALARDEMTFLAADHPSVRSAMEYVLTSGQGLSSVGLWLDERQQQLYAECLFRVSWTADASLPVDRFIKQTLFHSLVDMQGRDCRELLPEIASHKLTDARQVGLMDRVKALRENIEQMVVASEPIVEDAFKAGVQQAVTDATQHFDDEIKRLEFLRQFNDHIRDDEIDALTARRDQTLAALQGCRLRLDAIRVIVRTANWG